MNIKDSLIAHDFHREGTSYDEFRAVRSAFEEATFLVTIDFDQVADLKVLFLDRVETTESGDQVLLMNYRGRDFDERQRFKLNQKAVGSLIFNEIVTRKIAYVLMITRNVGERPIFVFIEDFNLNHLAKRFGVDTESLRPPCALGAEDLATSIRGIQNLLFRREKGVLLFVNIYANRPKVKSMIQSLSDLHKITPIIMDSWMVSQTESYAIVFSDDNRLHSRAADLCVKAAFSDMSDTAWLYTLGIRSGKTDTLIALERIKTITPDFDETVREYSSLIDEAYDKDELVDREILTENKKVKTILGKRRVELIEESVSKKITFSALVDLMSDTLSKYKDDLGFRTKSLEEVYGQIVKEIIK